MLEILPKLITSHAGFAYISLVLLLARGVLAAKGGNWRQFKVLTIAPHLVDTLLLVSGGVVTGVMLSNDIYTLGEMSWLLGKFLFIVLYIIFAAKAFKKNQPFSLKFHLAAVASFLIAMMMAVMH